MKDKKTEREKNDSEKEWGCQALINKRSETVLFCSKTVLFPELLVTDNTNDNNNKKMTPWMQPTTPK